MYRQGHLDSLLLALPRGDAAFPGEMPSAQWDRVTCWMQVTDHVVLCDSESTA